MDNKTWLFVLFKGNQTVVFDIQKIKITDFY